MIVGRDVERLIADWLVEEAVPSAPDRVLDGARRIIEATSQRRTARVFRVAWDITPRLRLFAIAAVVVVMIGGISLLALGSLPRRNETPPPSPPPQRSTAPSTSPTTSPSPRISGSPSEPVQFTSSRFGYSITLPTGYRILTGDPPWPLSTAPGIPSNLVADYLKDGSSTSNQLYGASWLVAKDTKPEAWLAAYEAAGLRTGVLPICRPTVGTLERTTIDGHPAWIHAGCSFIEAVVVAGNRVYEFVGFHEGQAEFPRWLFDPMMQSVRLSP